MLDQLIRMPLFPRKKTFCTRLPIHVRLRRPDAARDECASVTMSVITAEAYRTVGYDVRRWPLEPCGLTGERLLTSGLLVWSRPAGGAAVHDLYGRRLPARPGPHGPARAPPRRRGLGEI